VNGEGNFSHRFTQIYTDFLLGVGWGYAEENRLDSIYRILGNGRERVRCRCKKV